MPSRGNEQRCEDEHRNGEMEHNAQGGKRQLHDHRPEGDLDAEESESDVGSSAGSGIALYPPQVPGVNRQRHDEDGHEDNRLPMGELERFRQLHCRLRALAAAMDRR